MLFSKFELVSAWGNALFAAVLLIRDPLLSSLSAPAWDEIFPSIEASRPEAFLRIDVTSSSFLCILLLAGQYCSLALVGTGDAIQLTTSGYESARSMKGAAACHRLTFALVHVALAIVRLSAFFTAGGLEGFEFDQVPPVRAAAGVLGALWLGVALQLTFRYSLGAKSTLDFLNLVSGPTTYGYLWLVSRGGASPATVAHVAAVGGAYVPLGCLLLDLALTHCSMCPRYCGACLGPRPPSASSAPRPNQKPTPPSWYGRSMH